MAENWFYAKSGQNSGPVSRERMLELLLAGELLATDLVWNSDLPSWVSANQGLGLGRLLPPPLPNAPHSLIGGLKANYAAPYFGFGSAISSCFRKFAKFSGRASRSEYWWFVLFIEILAGVSVFGFALVGSITDDRYFDGDHPFLVLGFLIVSLVLCVPSCAVLVRRLHDTGRSGWWVGGQVIGFFSLVAIEMIRVIARGSEIQSGQMEMMFAPIVFGIGFFSIIGLGVVIFIFTLLKGQAERNKYNE